MFEACAAAQARGNELYIQITCQPLSFDFTLASAYPFYSHPAFDPIKAYDREQLKAVFRDPSFRERFRDDLRNPKPGTVFQGNWDRIIVAAPVKPKNAGLANRTIADIAREQRPRPARRVARSRASKRISTPASSAASSTPSTTGSSRWSSTRPASSRCPMPARIWSICAMPGSACISSGIGCASAARSTSPEGVRRLTSHQAGLYGIPDRGRIAVGACADLLLFDPATVGISPPRRVNVALAVEHPDAVDEHAVHADRVTQCTRTAGGQIALLDPYAANVS